jgi:CspA family cold shock protein
VPNRIIKGFDHNKGYGFIKREDGGDIFVPYSSIHIPGFKSLAEGDRVSFEAEETKRGSERNYL